MREIIVRYCDDCPIIRMCRDEGKDCEYTRYVHKVVSEAPPLTDEQIQTIATILRSARVPDETKPYRKTRRKAHNRSGPFKCQVPGCVATPLKHSGTLWQHVNGSHRISMAEYRARYGDPVPLTPAELNELVIEARCEHCGQLYSTARGHRFPHQALISHLRGRHGLKEDGTPVGEPNPPHRH